MTCQKCGSRNIIPDVERDGCTKREYLKCLMCGQEYKGEKPPDETINSTIQEILNNDNPEKIEEKEVVVEEQKTIKGAHKPCKNHPEKYAVKEGLCQRCYVAEFGKAPNVKEKQDEADKVDEGKAVTIDNKYKKMVEDGVFDEFNKAKFSTKEGKPVFSENWGKVDGVIFGEGSNTKQQDYTAVKICEIWQVKDGEATAEIIFKGETFHGCEIGGNILLDSGDFASLELDDWLFLGKVAREIERLAGVR
jgi:cytochrome c5